MKRLNITSKGKVIPIEVPNPGRNEVGIVCSVRASAISPGTETAGITQLRQGLIQKALQTDNLFGKLKRKLKTGEFWSTILGKSSGMQSPFPSIPAGMGYSSAGVVIERGEQIKDIEIGDRVACAGSPHAEEIYVPRNLFVKMPDNVSFEEGAFVALGSIAMHGVRRAQSTFGETFAVVGVGVIGQLTLQILKVIGCKVVVSDKIDARLELARTLGADIAVNVAEQSIVDTVMDFTGGIGADGVIICAASQSPQIVEYALAVCRDKGRVVVVGAVKMDLPRPPLYNKEIDFLISRSYGPGRYDECYEEKGLDYPLEEVRWTENRNMEEFLRLVSVGKINLKSLITHRFPFKKANDVYSILIDRPDEALGVVLNYEDGVTSETTPLPKTAPKPPKLKVGLIGAGSFARAVHIPNLESLADFELYAVSTRSKDSANSLKNEFGFQIATNDYREILRDDKIDLVLIATRHNLHAPIAIEALESGKHVFVEKPMGMTKEECEKVIKAVEATKLRLSVGFNRRFSQLVDKAKELIADRKNPIMLVYRVVSGFSPANHWIFDPIEGGGRIIGEACHFFDLIRYLMDEEPTILSVSGGNISHADGDKPLCYDDNVIVNMKFEDNSIATLIYGDLGHLQFPKERLELFAGNRTIVIDDFVQLLTKGTNQPNIKLNQQDKGYKSELVSFAEAIRNDKEPLITAYDGLRATELCLETIRLLRSSK